MIADIHFPTASRHAANNGVRYRLEDFRQFPLLLEFFLRAVFRRLWCATGFRHYDALLLGVKAPRLNNSTFRFRDVAHLVLRLMIRF